MLHWLILLILTVAFIVLATAQLKWHPMLALLLAAYGVGIAGGLGAGLTTESIKSGFGNTLGSIGIVIASGTIIGGLLEASGGAQALAGAIVRIVGQARSIFAMSLTGAVVPIPVFCDSGFILLSPLNKSFAKKTGKSLAAYSVALSMGLYATHVFIPPTPGPIAPACSGDTHCDSINCRVAIDSVG